MDKAIREHCAEIDRCNQRGGRMLSIADLIEAETVSPELAAYCLAAVGNGASFMVGAVPGGAGKTTVMGALLNLVPTDIRLVVADGMAAIERGTKTSPGCCYICHEIGSGPYYAYLWGRELRAYFALPEAGHMLATNLHADTYAQARGQICEDNGVSEASLRRMNLMLFLSVGPGDRRRIEEVWQSDGRNPHQRVFPAASPPPPGFVSAGDIEQATRTIDHIMAGNARTIEQVRTIVVQRRAGAM